jgi:hypothetical protein
MCYNNGIVLNLQVNPSGFENNKYQAIWKAQTDDAVADITRFSCYIPGT